MKSIFSLILFAYNFMIGYSKKKKTEKLIGESAFNKRKKRPGLKSNPRVSANRRLNSWALGGRELVPRASRLLSPFSAITLPKRCYFIG